MKRVVLAVTVGLVGLAVFLVNPRFVQGVLMEDDAFDAPIAGQMRAAVEGEWLLELPDYVDIDPHQIRFEVRQAGPERRSTAPSGLVQEAAACGHHTLVRSAGACLDAWEMPLEFELIAGPAPAGKIESHMVVYGNYVGDNRFIATIDGKPFFEAQLTPEGVAEEVDTRWTAGARLTRVAMR